MKKTIIIVGDDYGAFAPSEEVMTAAQFRELRSTPPDWQAVEFERLQRPPAHGRKERMEAPHLLHEALEEAALLQAHALGAVRVLVEGVGAERDEAPPRLRHQFVQRGGNASVALVA